MLKTARLPISKILLAFMLVCMTVIFISLSAINANAADNTIYISNTSGQNSNAGKTAAAPVKTLDRAFQVLADNSGTIVVMDSLPIAASFEEPAHKGEITITANDGTTNYSSSGANLKFGSALRYVLAGPTVFKDITVDFAGTINFVANFNPVTFDTGFTLVNSSSAGQMSAYVVGGYQEPTAKMNASLDSHITIKSGDLFKYVIGFSRQKASGEQYLTHTGTSYITIEGGKIGTVYGASSSTHHSGSTVMNMTGGYVDTLSTGGDVTRRLNGTASVSISGGEVHILDVHNVVGDATVTLAGGKVDATRVTYENTTIQELAAKSIKTIYYNANFYSASQIEAYCKAFDVAENMTNIYVKAGAAGNGTTPENPTGSLKSALDLVNATGGSVCVIGTLDISGAFSENAHAKEIIIRGADDSAVLNFAAGASYTIAGPTTFDKITIKHSGEITFNANGNAVKFGKDTKCDSAEGITVYGVAENASTAAGTNITLLGGKFETVVGYAANASVSGNSSITLDGATVGTLYIGNSASGDVKSASVDILSGNITNLYTGSAISGALTVRMGGGSVGKLLLNNVSGTVSLELTGGKISEFENSGSSAAAGNILNFNEKVYTEKDFTAIANLFAGVKSTKVVFVKAGGTGSGTSSADPVGTLTDAYAGIGADGGTIVVCGALNVSDAFIAPAHSGEIIITSSYAGVDYSGAKMAFKANFYIGGTTKFENIELVAAGSYKSIFAQGKKLTIGDNVKVSRSDTTTYLSIMGGGIGVGSDITTDVTINSGDWSRIRGGNAGTGGMNRNVNVNLTIGGGVFHERVLLGCATSMIGDINVTINGGDLQAGYIVAAPLQDDTYSGNVKVTINGGKIYDTMSLGTPCVRSTFSGTYALTINGGDFTSLTEIRGSEKFDGTMTSSLTAGPNVDFSRNETGTITFTNYLRSSADPWIFVHDGMYYYTATGSTTTVIRKAANISDLKTAPAYTIYTPAEGKEYSKNIWSPEIHYYSADDVGAENAGWYLYIACDDGDNTNHRMYVVKCLTDDLLGPWGNPVTKEVNVPIKVTGVDTSVWAAGQTDIRINGKLYAMYVTEADRPTQSFHQTINIAEMENPWTLKNPSVICTPTLAWEEGGHVMKADGTWYPKVVEGGTAVYGDNGEVYVIYSGSGYWTTEYKLGQLTYKGGDPMDINNWEKASLPVLNKSDSVNGCGHACYFTDFDGTKWICYHAYTGKDTASGRFAFVEPYTFDKDGIVIGDGTGRPADISKQYTINVNPKSILEKADGFDKVTYEKIAEKFPLVNNYTEGMFTDLAAGAWYLNDVKTAYRIGFMNGMSAAKFAPDGSVSVAQAITMAARVNAIYGGKTAPVNSTSGKWYDNYVAYAISNGIITSAQFNDYERAIKRSEMAEIFAKTLPDSEYTAINSVKAIPDVAANSAYASAVFKLYNAGILGGSDAKGTFYPETDIKRSEAAAIINRFAFPANRKTLTF